MGHHVLFFFSLLHPHTMSAMLPTHTPLEEASTASVPAKWVVATAGLLGLALGTVFFAAPTATNGLWTAIQSAPSVTAARSVMPPTPRPMGAAPVQSSAQQAAAAPQHDAHQGVGLAAEKAPFVAGSPLLVLPLMVLVAAALGLRRTLTPTAEQLPIAMAATTSRRPKNGKRILVLGGSGYVGSRVCKYAIEQGYDVVALSRRGKPEDATDLMDEVEWRVGDALETETIQGLVSEGFDGIVHAIGCLFDSASGLGNLNTIVSGSKSLPAEGTTYDLLTRQTGEDLVDAVLASTPRGAQIPVAFVSAAEAGWPDVQGGPMMDDLVPDFLKRYLKAKRTVEARFAEPNDNKFRPLVFRPSLMWDWGKLDVLPVIPVFWLANAVGVPFVDRPVRVETIAASIVASLGDASVQGVQRFPEMESLSKRSKWEF
mmetsp:Transcript_62755/g.111903  ORF Transcript_62755/g.111903 Transcript_62755/m.111903 type:complete len:428 (-) Transcript_62755:617-1900(-)